MSAQEYNEDKILAVQQTDDLMLYNVAEANTEWLQTDSPADLQDKE